MEVLQLLNIFLAPSGFADVGQQMHHFVTGEMDINKGKHCDKNCFFQTTSGKGDYSEVEVFGEHKIAEKYRLARKLSAEK